MIVGGGLFLIVGLLAENYTLVVGSLAVMFIGVLCEK
jgi:hypothetical protein